MANPVIMQLNTFNRLGTQGTSEVEVHFDKTWASGYNVVQYELVIEWPGLKYSLKTDDDINNRQFYEENGVLKWVLQQTDTSVNGYGKCQIRAFDIDNKLITLSPIYLLYLEPKIGGPYVKLDLNTIAHGGIYNIEFDSSGNKLIITYGDGYTEEIEGFAGGGDNLPPYSESDNGKYLQIVNGQPSWQNLPAYDGEYSVIPQTLNDVALSTAQTYLTSNIIVQRVPRSDTSNSSGGITVTIGG